MPGKYYGRIIGESFREVNRRRRSRRGIRENFHRLSGHCWFGITIVASLSNCHWGQYTYVTMVDLQSVLLSGIMSRVIEKNTLHYPKAG